MTEADQAEVLAVPDRTRTRLRQALTAQIDRSDAIEVTVEAGDCILLDPMCTPHTLPAACHTLDRSSGVRSSGWQAPS